MRSIKLSVAALSVALLLGGGVSQAGTDLNEVGAFLVYPAVQAFGIAGPTETYLAIVNTGSSSVNAHIAFVNGDEESDEYCFECNYTIPLTPNDTELLTVTPFQAGGVQITSEDGTLQGACPHPFGMVTVNLEDAAGNVITDNVLLGSEVVVAYGAGLAFSVPAIPFQGKNGGNGDRRFGFDDAEYGKFPRVIAADFIAPALAPATFGQLFLFTLGFEAEFPPFSHCEIEGYDAAENPFSRSFNFGCWSAPLLRDLHTEFLYGNLGQTACTPGLNCNTHGWLKLDCDVTDGTTTVPGGVHGSIVQYMAGGGKIRQNDPNSPTAANSVAWGRNLYQSVSTGGSVSFHLAGGTGGGGLD